MWFKVVIKSEGTYIFWTVVQDLGDELSSVSGIYSAAVKSVCKGQRCN